MEQEAEARNVLAELDRRGPGGQEFVPSMAQFTHAVRAHVACEEQRG